MQRGTGAAEVGNRSFNSIYDALQKQAYASYLGQQGKGLRSGADTEQFKAETDRMFKSGQLKESGLDRRLGYAELRSLDNFRDGTIDNNQYGLELQSARDSVDASFKGGKISNEEYSLELQNRRDRDDSQYKEGIITEKEYANRLTSARDSVEAGYKAALVKNNIATANLYEGQLRDINQRIETFRIAMESGGSLDQLNAAAILRMKGTPVSDKRLSASTTALKVGEA
jgi:hypothetical protein